MQSKGGTRGSGIDSHTRSRARELLEDVLAWELPAGVWPRPAEAVGLVAAALAQNDGTALDSATAALELLSPHRVERVRDPADLPPPATLRERVVALVHLLEEPDRTTAKETTDASAPDER